MNKGQKGDSGHKWDRGNRGKGDKRGDMGQRGTRERGQMEKGIISNGGSLVN